MADIFVRDANLVSLMEKTGYNITQENGQRKFGPPPGWIGPRPPKGSEIFIGKLPRDVYEDELVPLCEQFGKIYELRLMLDFNDENRGYSFVTYTNVDDAINAIKHLDDYEIRPGRHIGVCKSIDNCRLFVGGIPKDKSKEEINAEITKCTEGVSKVILYSSIVDKSKNRGFAFVEYETHRAAAMARRKLLASKIKLFDHDIAVDWAQPEDEVEKEIIKRVDEVMDICPSHDEEPYFVQSMPFVKDHRCNSRYSSSSSASSLLETSWQYTAFRWKKRERKCTAKAAHGSQMVPSLGDFFPVMSSSDSSSSMNTNVAPNETCLSYWKRTDRILCERCKLKYNENAAVRFINTQCFHFFCESCIRFLFSSENLIKPVVCITCNQRLKKLHNRYI